MRISDWSSDVCSSDLQGDPLDPSVQVGAQASEDQLHKILGYIDIGKAEGAQCLVGGAKALPGGALDQGYFVQPTVFVGQNHMRIFQEEIFGPVLAVTTFKTVKEDRKSTRLNSSH